MLLVGSGPSEVKDIFAVRVRFNVHGAHPYQLLLGLTGVPQAHEIGLPARLSYSAGAAVHGCQVSMANEGVQGAIRRLAVLVAGG